MSNRSYCPTHRFEYDSVFCPRCGVQHDSVFKCSTPTCKVAIFAGDVFAGPVDDFGKPPTQEGLNWYCSQCAARRRTGASGTHRPTPSVSTAVSFPPRPQLAPPKARIDRVLKLFDVWNNGRPGMEFHIHFHIANYRGESGRVCAFVYEESGNPVRNDGEDRYVTPSGFLTVQETFTPAHDQAAYSDFRLFLPYNQFYSGSHNYYAVMEIQDGHGNNLDKKRTGGFKVRRHS